MKLFLKSFLLIIIGVILSLIILECGLRIAGWTIFSYQQYKNNKALRNKSQYTIMCLGESTTQGQYPVQLQQILNKKYPNKFSIIDCGFSGTNLENILNLLDNNIDKYKPNITICMMGINNGLTNKSIDTDNIEYVKKSNSTNFKIYKLYMLIKEHLKVLLQNNSLFAETLNTQDVSSLCNLSNKYYWSGNYKKAKEISEQILQIDPLNEEALYLLVTLYFYHLEQNTENLMKAYELSLNAIDNNISFNRPKFYIICINYCVKNNIKIDSLLEKLLNDNFDMKFLNSTLELYRLVKNDLSKEQLNTFKEKILSQNDEMSIAFNAIDFLEKKNYLKFQEYFNKAEEIRLNFPNDNTYNLYKLIIRKLVDNNIKVLCMQYPIRSILPLQEQLKNEPYYDKITFISNKKIFKQALINKRFDDLFIDQFAGDFGHCTDLGNTMIAENVVKTLENILNLKQN